ncbi:thiamine biosynthesis lipoprotein [Bradyrhizobium sp. cir1]|uniref:FAD:protein FMN transferase n=1 Tax=Bradyrhizobium sp. cir1 TaxID=1445730 RepID=UPI001606D18C|nr:FAD:protein FMN transferase [Bradyrhizobium sp. cir1]MBB4372714.1 thiamine biosynthesis lipoprotein [Bradyrhizobium sp. cir1]
MRRARPLLGTIVEIEVDGVAQAAGEQAIAGAFEAVSLVQRLMSFHDANSDIGRINREAFRMPVTIHPWTARVLRHAQTFHAASNGLFDCAVGFELMRHDLLPSDDLDHVAAGDFNAVRLSADRSVRLTAPVAIDLGGIAKGYAVDRAIASLRAAGIRTATVNAGGDLRVMGEIDQPIHVHVPNGGLVPAGHLRNGAIATSSAVATVDRIGACRPPSSGTDGRAYSVVAPSCIAADALTKILVQTGEPQHPCFARFGATAFITGGNLPSMAA